MLNLYSFSLKTLEGKALNWEDYSNKKVLLVNTASACGYTPQYKQLQELHSHFKEELLVLGCPSNDFGNQEPGSKEEIAEFCSVRFGVEFPLSEKLIVLGEKQHPLFKALEEEIGEPVKWNFQKFIFDEKGDFIKTLASGAEPLGEEILDTLGLKV